MAIPLRAALDEARRAPIPTGLRSAEPMLHGSMVLRCDVPQGADRQTPRDQDEIDAVASGRGAFVCAGACVPLGPGDAPFAAAGAGHRFEDFSGDFGTWVVFYGPKGGENG